MLALPDFNKLCIVETDTSSMGLGVALPQEGHPIVYFSKKLNEGLVVALEFIYIQKLYTVTKSISKWRHYLLGKQFTIRTDHQNLKEL